jgi:Transposase DDE domain
MTAAPVVPTLQDPTTRNRPPGALFGASCERRAKVDQTIAPDGYCVRLHYPAHPLQGHRDWQDIKFMTNSFELPTLTIAALYKNRWQVELFFKWIKQHLRIKRFYGSSENAVKTQIWIAVSVYVFVAIVKKQLHLDATLYTLMQVISVTIFEKPSIHTALLSEVSQCDIAIENN